MLFVGSVVEIVVVSVVGIGIIVSADGIVVAVDCSDVV